MNHEDYWYICCPSDQLKSGKVFQTKILDVNIAVFRSHDGKVSALPDRCLHRVAPLSEGRVTKHGLQCPYHGWTYDTDGTVTHVPAEGPGKPSGNRCLKPFPTVEQDDYVYICLNRKTTTAAPSFRIPSYKQSGFAHIRLINEFENNVTNCAENFVDIPHTTFVHPNIFRNSTGMQMSALVRRENGNVYVKYEDEVSNFGWFNFFLNPKKKTIEHIDEFLSPNITRVTYGFGKDTKFYITSQSIPITPEKTVVYTDLTFNYGIWNIPAKWIVKIQAQAIIDQDIRILKQQMQGIRKYGHKFQNSPCDTIHTFIENLRNEIDHGRDPRDLPPAEKRIEFWV